MQLPGGEAQNMAKKPQEEAYQDRYQAIKLVLEAEQQDEEIKTPLLHKM